MNNFIDNGLVALTGLALPGTKADVAGAPSIPPANAWAAADGNASLGALADIKTVLGRQVSIMSFGADPTGAGDSSTAFSSAFTALSSGGSLVIPAGTYRIASVVTCPSGVLILGNSKLTSVLNLSGSGQLNISGNNIELRDLQITSSSSPSVPAISLAVDCSTITIKNCFFSGCLAGGVVCAGAVIDVLVSGCLLTGNCVSGSYTANPVVSLGNGSSFHMRVEDCYFSNNSDTATGQALTITAGGRVSIARCYFESSGNAILLQSQMAGAITECGFENMAGTSGCIVANYNFNVGSLSVRDCNFSIYSGWTVSLPIITSNASAVSITGNYFVGNPSGFITSNGITLAAIQGANLSNVVISGNSCPDDSAFATQIQQDADFVYGSVDSYTNLALHSSFEDASHVTAAGGAGASQASGSGVGYLGNTAQQIAWIMGGSQTAQFTNAIDTGTQVGDQYTISFYAKVTSGTPQPPDEPFQMYMLGSSAVDGYFAFVPTSTWKRFVFKSLPATHAETHTLYMRVPQTSGGALTAITILIDGLQVEKNVHRPHPLATTTSTAVTVSNVNTWGT